MKIIWFNESSIQVRFDSWQALMFREKSKKYNSERLCLLFKSKYINIMIWDCSPWNRLDALIVCELRGIEAEEYIEILLKRLSFFVNDLLSAEDENIIHVKWSEDFIFMQNDISCHKALDIMRFLKEFDFQVIIVKIFI